MSAYPTVALRRMVYVDTRGTGAIKGTLSPEYQKGLFPGYSASGQDVWLPAAEARYSGRGLVLSAVGARCGKVFLADGRWGVAANTTVLSVRPGFDPRFAWYVTNNEDFWEKGSTAQPYVQMEPSLSLPVPVPPLETQRRIADFLDDQTARIDNIIKARQKQIVLLQDLRDAEWATLVRELDEAFDVVPIRRVVASITDGPFGSSLTSSHYADSGIRVVRLGNIGLNSFRDEDKAYISNEYGRSLHRYSVAPGDVLMAGLGDEKWPLGRCAMAPSELGDAIVKADCYRLRLTTQLQARYFAWYLSSPDARHRFIDLARGATRARLNTDIAMSATIAVPPIQVQNEALREIEKSATLIGQVENALRESIGYLQELKRSLITSAVSGEFDVSTADGSGVVL